MSESKIIRKFLTGSWSPANHTPPIDRRVRQRRKPNWSRFKTAWDSPRFERREAPIPYDRRRKKSE